jgi:peptide-methionine (S)-S-oxide reductase
MNQKQREVALPKRLEKAVFGGGCFWCTEAVFSQLKGVEKVEPGYSGGDVEHPIYEQVSAGTTGHAEAIRISFDSNVISFREMVQIFFSTHDPTTLNRQGPDVGSQYRSVIFYLDAQQKTTAEQVIREMTEEKVWNAPIVTALEPFKAFYPAEGYHMHYFRRHPEKSYCTLVIAPKLAKLRQKYMSRLKV